MSDVIDVPADIERAPLEIEPCELCGCAIEDLEELIYLRAADLVTQWELADPRDAWRHTGEPAPAASVRNSDISAKPASATRPYRTPQATIKAFWYVAGLDDAGYLKRWLAQHPLDVETLQKLWEAKHAGA
jgi:hypothetical protein